MSIHNLQILMSVQQTDINVLRTAPILLAPTLAAAMLATDLPTMSELVMVCLT